MWLRPSIAAKAESVGVAAEKTNAGNIISLTDVIWSSLETNHSVHFTFGEDGYFATYEDSVGYIAVFSNPGVASVDVEIYDPNGDLIMDTTISIDADALNALESLAAKYDDPVRGRSNV